MAALSLFFLFLLRLLFDSFSRIAVLAAARGDPLVLPLHRRSLPSDAATGNRLDYLKELFYNDLLRHQMIGRRIQQPQGQQHRRQAEESFRMPLGSGAYARVGQYFVELWLGTPAQQFEVVADTGSDLTWVKCLLKGEKAAARDHVFRSDLSSSFKPILCSSEMCKNSLPFSLAACPSPTSLCAYDYRYFEGVAAKGVYANESAVVTLASGGSRELRELAVGCTSSTAGSSFEVVDGVLGLGYSELSFPARVTTQFGGLFSYCLVDHLSSRSVSSFLSFGAAAGSADGELRETPLVLDPNLGTFYFVEVEGISVDGKLLPIPASVWRTKAGGGTIVDSGTSLMMLAEPAYKEVVTALNRPLGAVPRASNMDPFEYCYNWTKAAPLPVMAMHFAGGARFEPPAKSYVIDAADGVKCLGITSLPSQSVSIIGNIIQQGHVWVFDVKNKRLRFGPSACTN